MKTILAISILLLSFGASANTSQCTDTLNNLTSLTYNYIDLYKICQNESPGSDFYVRAQELARDVESNYERGIDLCHRVCDARVARRSCTSELTGACP